MDISFITRAQLSFDEAPTIRILNIRKVLDKHHNVSIICQRSNWKEPNVYGIPQIIPGFLGNQIFKILVFFTSVYLMLAKKIDIFVVRQYYFVLLLHPLAKLFGAKIIYDMHCFRYKELKTEGKSLKSIIIKPLELFSHKLAYKILVISEGIMEDLPKNLRNKAIMVPNGVNLDDFKVKKDSLILKKYKIPNKPLIGFVGNWMEWVDVPTFLKSSEYLKNATFLVVGEGYITQSYRQLKKKYTNVIFTGRIPHKDVVGLLNYIDICILPYKKAEVVKHLSVRKTFEYLAAGKPIIMSDSDLSDKSILKENKNIISYKAEDAKDLALKVKYLLGNKKLMNEFAENNKTLSKKFSWEQRVNESKLLETLNTYIPSKKFNKSKISIIIKAYNEEKYIGRCIKSALAALKGLNGEVILVDSKSSDKTIEIAKKYPIKIIQLKNGKERRCGIGPQTGYLYSKGDYVYILDGDMTIDKDFIKKALPFFASKCVAGVGGNIIEKSKDNLAFQVRSKYHIVNKITEVNQLGMGGLYRRNAIEDVGYFSNPYFFAYEEYDLGAKLSKEGYKLIRIPEKMIEHFGDETNPFQTLASRWKSRYLFGSGQYLRRSVEDKHFMKTFNELKIYIITLVWIVIGFLSLVSLIWSYKFLITYAIITFTIAVLLLIKKRDFKRLSFSFFSWNMQSLGTVVGFLCRNRSPNEYKANVRIVK